MFKALIPKWSHLAVFGNTALAKLVILAPIVAQFVYYQDFLKEYFSLEKPLWLYWSLIALSAGQLLYSWKCPDIIKRHGGSIESYTDEAFRTWPEENFDRLALQLARAPFLRWGGNQLAVLTTAEDLSQKELSRKVTAKSRSHDDQKYAVSIIHRLFTADALRPGSVNAGQPETFAEALQNLADDGATIDSDTATSVHALLARRKMSDKEWQSRTIAFDYSRTNRSNVVVRIIVGGLFAIGSMYFVYASAENIVEITKITVASIAT